MHTLSYYVALLPFFLMLVIIGLVVFIGFCTVPGNCDEVQSMRLINELREHEGALVEIACDNPEPDTVEDQACVTVTDDWTDWNPKTIYGQSVLDCLQKAKFQRDCARTIENPPRA